MQLEVNLMSSTYHNRCTRDGRYYWHGREVATIRKVGERRRHQEWLLTPHNKKKHGLPISANTRRDAAYLFERRMRVAEQLSELRTSHQPAGQSG